MMDFPLYASLILLAIGLAMVAAFAAVKWLDDMRVDDPDWDGREEP